MATPRVCVLRAPGTNCDHETAFAFTHCGAEAERLHLFRVLEQPEILQNFQVLCIPGGFSYGDDVGAGVVFSSQLKNRLGDAIGEFLNRDTLTLGICNGFQVLLKAGILPGGAAGWSSEKESAPQATLTWNANGRYTDLWVKLKNCSKKNVFLRGIETLDCPIAHGEGRLVVTDPAVVKAWEDADQIALRYTGETESASDSELLPFPQNPNGSIENIAGLGDPSGRVLGLMPHPERFLFATQHPRWTRLGLRGEGAGFQVFRNAVEYFQ
ncbi:phosphoribosylformylglycinamidine synthase subunit PurQ [Planctomicrobium sp. SH661]|uniref:phosphoribosylformylglycinamidine synthase subunit PurQ n=1 Tax=Planctomicrobium sp. SH661 TaxID=3448124 RepID=UPI003F5BEEC6